MIKNKTGIPEKPGIYLFKAAPNKILYIGKALNLKKRVSQYFRKSSHPVLERLLAQATIIDWIVTEDERDALLLEYNLVQSYRPPFNIRLKDDKTYPSIEISRNEHFPAIYFTRRPTAGNFFLGPISSSGRTKNLIDIVTRLFRIRPCSNRTFAKGTPCLYYHIERCSAPCTGRVSHAEYRQKVDEAIDFLNGEKSRISRRFEADMRQAAADLNFERAQQIKEDLELIRIFKSDSYITSPQRADFDALAVAVAASDREAHFSLFSVEAGRVRRSEYFTVPSVGGSTEEVLKEFMLHFYQQQNLPAELIVSRNPAERENLQQLFSQLAGRRVRIRVPVRGVKRKILSLAAENLDLYVARNRYEGLASELQQMLRLRRPPQRIEGYDISHLAETDRVGAVVVFDRGVAMPHLYRSYTIRRAAAGDTEALAEVLERRLTKLKNRPDLLLIDGGRPQLGAAMAVMRRLGIDVDVIALAKEEERVFLEKGGSLVPAKGSPLRHLLQNVRDEAHRRARAHHRRRREKIG